MSYTTTSTANQNAPSLREAALDFANGGIPVFPCAAGTKRPACANGFKDATTDIAQIEAWWAENPDYNVAIYPEPAGMCVIDTDPPVGEDNWAALETEHGLAPDTWTVCTPRGGRHRYFKGSLPPSVGKLAPKIDIRSRGSYVLVPPSRTADGVYTTEDARAPADLPVWVSATLATSNVVPIRRSAEVALDEPQNVARALAYLKRAPLAIQDHAGDNQTLKVANEVLDLGVSAEKALELMAEHWNPRCDPPWEEDDLRTKVENAERYRQNDIGAYALRTTAETFAESPAVQEALKAATPKQRADAPEKRPRVVLRDEAMQDARPPVRWLVESLLPERGTAAIHAQYGSFKSFAAVDLALSVASGRKAFRRFSVRRPGPVVYLLGEGAGGVETLRRPAWRLDRHIPDDERLPIYTVEGVPQVRSAEDLAANFEAVDQLATPPRLIIVDTLSRAMAGLNENDAGDAGLYLDAVEALVQRYDCCVLTIMHEGKDTSRGGRGSSAFAAGFDVVWQMDGDADARVAKISAEKVKDGERPAAIHLQGREVALPDGRKSLVFDWVESDDYKRAASRRGGITNSDVGAALIKLGAVGGQTQPTRVLATELAGPDADENVVAAIEKSLQRGSKTEGHGNNGRFAAHVGYLGRGGNDPTLWTFREPDRGVAAAEG